MTNKELLLFIAVVVVAVISGIVLFTWVPRNPDDLLAGMIGLVAVMIVLLLGLPFFLHQDWRREVRKHVREFHSSDLKP